MPRRRITMVSSERQVTVESGDDSLRELFATAVLAWNRVSAKDTEVVHNNGTAGFAASSLITERSPGPEYASSHEGDLNGT